jgi:FdhD protein
VLQASTRSQIDVDVAIGKSFKSVISSVRTATFLASPQELDALATGFLLCEGLGSIT